MHDGGTRAYTCINVNIPSAYSFQISATVPGSTSHGGDIVLSATKKETLRTRKGRKKNVLELRT